MSFADGFRTLQAVRDLRVLASRAPVETQARIASGIPHKRVSPEVARDAISAMIGGSGFDPGLRDDVLQALRLTAALPGEDYPAFLLATMLLLSEALEGAGEIGDIPWYWQTFRGHYRVAAAAERAAIAQAIRRIGLRRGSTESLPGTVPDLATAPAAALRPLIARRCTRGLAPPEPTAPQGVAALLLDAFGSAPAAVEAARLWAADGARLAREMPAELLAGFRHLYETLDGWAPDTDIAIPLLDPPPGVSWPR